MYGNLSSTHLHSLQVGNCDNSRLVVGKDFKSDIRIEVLTLTTLKYFCINHGDQGFFI